jgi:endonuclease YncB( thermonuclease family)
MLGWFKRSDGFEWKEYVRTTVRLRREDRKRKIVAAKGAVAKGVKEAGVASVSASSTLAQKLVRGLGRGLRATGRGIASLALMLRTATVVIGLAIARIARRIGHVLAPPIAAIARFLGQRPVRLGSALVAGVAATWALSRYRAEGVDGEVTAAGTIAAVAALVALLPIIAPPITAGLARAGRLLGNLGVTPRMAGYAAGAVAVVVLGAGAYQAAMKPGGPSLASSLPSLPRLGILSTPEISGRAMAVSGDTLRLDGKLIGLAGIEAPDLAQVCTRAGKQRWRCGVAATEALSQKIRREVVTCAPTGREDRGRQMARCRVGEEDIAATLVKAGWVFAESGFLSAYGRVESEAQAKKVGLWAGEAERPDAWRTRLFADAKKKAPNNCPVKGIKASTGPRYVMPWESDYDRLRVRVSRGERWFCSEDEARAAGFKLSS